MQFDAAAAALVHATNTMPDPPPRPGPANEDLAWSGVGQAISNFDLSGAWSPRDDRLIRPGHLGLALASQGLADFPCWELANALLSA
jgi:hypothetical protein